MWLPWSVVLLLAQGQPLAQLTIVPDTDARIVVDGEDLGLVRAGERRGLALTPGEKKLEAWPTGGTEPWRKAVFLGSALPVEVKIPVRAFALGIEVRKLGYWVDERTRLTWAANDNGFGVTVSQAHSYCRHLRLAGKADWRLPQIDELQTIFGGTADERGFRLVAPLRISGWAWSATQGNEEAENWALDFGDGARASVVAGDAGLNRALCVR